MATFKIKKILPWLLVCILFAGAYIAYTWPLATHWDTQIIGKLDKQSDVPVFYNNIYLFEKKVQAGQNPLHNDMEMHPMGFSMAMNSHNFSMGLFCLLFKNNMLGLNVGLLISFVLSGLGAALLCYRFVPNYGAALLAGFIFAFSPWKMIKLQDHLWYALTAAIPFYIYHFIDVFNLTTKNRLPSIASYKKLVYCILLGIFTALSEYYLAFFLFYFSGLYILIIKYIRPWQFNYKKIKTWVVLAGGFIGGGILVSLFSQWGLDDKGAIYWGGDLGAYFLPFYAPWAKDLFSNLGIHIPSHQENYFFLGFSFLVFSLIVFFISRKKVFETTPQLKTFAWLSLLLVMLTLPAIKIFGHFFIYNPTAIIHYIPFVNNVRVITRIFLLFSLLFPILVLWYFNSSVKKQLVSIVSVVLVGILFIEYNPTPYHTINYMETPNAVFTLRDTKGKVVLPIPAGIRDGFIQQGLNNSDMLYYQTIFDKKMIGGYTARLSPKIKDYYTADSVMQDVFTLSEKPDTTLHPKSNAAIQSFMDKFSPDIIFIHPDWNKPGVVAYISTIATKNDWVRMYSEDYVIFARK